MMPIDRNKLKAIPIQKCGRRGGGKMRDICFRAWDEDCEVMYYSDGENEDCIFGFNKGSVVAWLRETEAATLDEPEYQYSKPVDVEQYTGLRDSKRTEEFPEGQKIWDGDLYRDKHGTIFKVQMKCDGWGLFPVKKDAPVRSLYWWNVCIHDAGEVIGSIHTHPELLEVKE
jgi:hypothetical protein